MLGDIIVLSPVVLVISLAVVLYLLFTHWLRRRSISVSSAAILYCLVLASAPLLLALLASQLGNVVIEELPAYRRQEMRVGMALGLAYGMFLNYAIALIAAIFGCRRFVILGRSGPDARAT